MKFFNILIFLSAGFLYGQVGIGTTAPNSSAALDIDSSNKGLLIPRVSLLSSADNQTILQPVTGLLVFNTSNVNDVTKGFYFWDGLWKPLVTTIAPSSGTTWNIGGNVLPNTNSFLGSTNYTPLVLKTNNNQVAKFHPLGGVSLGNNALANDNNSIAIGTSANASAATQSIALGYSSTASGYQSMALGTGAQSAGVSGLAVGLSASASGYQSTALGLNANASGQNATAIGYNAQATIANTIILGDSTNNFLKVGIGTNMPDEKLHLVGNLKIVDGNQSNGFVLTSDSTGKASWQNPDKKSYGFIFYNTTGQTLNQFNNINFGTTGVAKEVNIDTDGITVLKTGVYRITYSITIQKNGGSSITTTMSVYKNYSTLVNGGNSTVSISNNQTMTLTGTVITPVNAYEKISIRSSVTDNNTTVTQNGSNLMIESLN